MGFDRVVGHTQSQVTFRLGSPLYSLNTDWKILSVRSGILAKQEARPPPLALGSPPQAKLRVWIL
jgi:hypothetical protein